MQRSDEWHVRRKDKITASNVGAMLGLCSYTSRKQALQRARGCDEFRGNSATRYGCMMERTVLGWYEAWKRADVGREVACVDDGFHNHPQHPWMGGSPDGLVEEDGIVEIKCPYNQRWAKLEGPLSATYYMQCQMLLWSYGRAYVDFVMYAGQRGCSVRRVTVDHELQEQLLPILEACHTDVRTKRNALRSIIVEIAGLPGAFGAFADKKTVLSPGSRRNRAPLARRLSCAAADVFICAPIILTDRVA